MARSNLAPYMGMTPRFSRKKGGEEVEKGTLAHETTYPSEDAELESWTLDEMAEKDRANQWAESEFGTMPSTASARDKEILRTLAQKIYGRPDDKEPESPMHPESDENLYGEESLIQLGSMDDDVKLWAGKPKFKSGKEEYEPYPSEEEEEIEGVWPEGASTQLTSTNEMDVFMGEPRITGKGEPIEEEEGEFFEEEPSSEATWRKLARKTGPLGLAIDKFFPEEETPYPINEELALSVGEPQITGQGDADITEVGGEHPGVLFPDRHGGFVFSPTTGPNAGLVFRVPEGAEAGAVLEQSAMAGEGYDSIEDLIAAESGGVINPETERATGSNTLPIDRAARSHLLGIGPEYGWASKNRVKR